MELNFNIYIDNIVFSLQRVGGISTCFGELIKRFLHYKSNVVFVEQECVRHNIVRNILSIAANKVLIEKAILQKLTRYLPINIELTNRSIVHSSYYRICNAANAANIITVYDFNYEFGYVRSGIRKYIHCWQKKYAVDKADGVICISESTKHDLLELYKNIEPEKIKVIYLAASDEFFKIPATYRSNSVEPHFKGVLAKKYVLFVGGRGFHKNFNVCVDTLAKLSEYELVIVGSELTDKETQSLDSKIPSRYHAFTNVPAPELNYLYNNAFCFLYPTSYEGFGIPVLEAMQAGCPVVSTNVSSIPEVSGKTGLLVDNICPDEFIKKIKSLENASYRDSVISAGFDQARKFSWDKTFKETVDFYNLVFKKKFES